MSDVLSRLTTRPERDRLTIALGVGLALALIALVFVWWSGRSDSARLDAIEEATKVAEERAVQITSYSGGAVDTSWLADGATANVADNFRKEAEALQATLEEIGANSTGTVVAAAGQATDDDRVEVLLFIDQSASSSSGSGNSRSSVRMVMVKSGGAWLVDDLLVR